MAGAWLEGMFTPDERLERLSIKFDSDLELWCVQEHSYIHPEMERRGYSRIIKREGKPRQSWHPIPWRWSEWLLGDHERVEVRLERAKRLLIITRTFNLDLPVKPAAGSLEALFF